ncbi:MAG: hypothetical protein M3Y33_14440, partial [Actinomycetota bacterium]|nr:hypothetical protein [Actinomycetota bacterium]
MFRLLDARLGVLTEVRPGQRGLLRVRVSGPSAGSSFDVADLRVLLVADVLARAAELRGLQVVAVLAAAGPRGGPAALERESSALNIHPPSAHAVPE